MRRVCSCFSSFAYLLLPFVLSLCSCFLSFCPSLLWLSFVVLFVGLYFLFPLRTIRKKKGRKGFAPCVLSCPVVGCFIWLLLCIPRTRQVSARLYRNKVLEKGNLIECSKLFCARLCSYLCSSKFVFLLFSFLFLLVGSCFLFPFGGVLVVILLLRFCLLPLCTPSLPHCIQEDSFYTIRYRHHRST